MVLVRVPAEPVFGAIAAAGKLTAVVDPERGATWPDRIGQELVRARLRLR
jgi:hypothetical protein